MEALLPAAQRADPRIALNAAIVLSSFGQTNQLTKDSPSIQIELFRVYFEFVKGGIFRPALGCYTLLKVVYSDQLLCAVRYTHNIFTEIMQKTLDECATITKFKTNKIDYDLNTTVIFGFYQFKVVAGFFSLFRYSDENCIFLVTQQSHLYSHHFNKSRFQMNPEFGYLVFRLLYAAVS